MDAVMALLRDISILKDLFVALLIFKLRYKEKHGNTLAI